MAYTRDSDSPLDLAGAVADWCAPGPLASTNAEMQATVRALQAISDATRILRTRPADSQLYDAEELDAPATWGTLRIIGKVASGSFGDVYQAEDPGLGRVVALKLMRNSASVLPQQHQSVVDEGHCLARIRHPNVVTVYGAGCFEGRVGLWMEYVEGPTLAERIESRGPMPIAEACDIIYALSDALQTAHRAGILHRDVKAQNVICRHDGSVTLVDFGTGQDRSTPHSLGGVGTPVYAAPEVLQGSVATEASEVYSLGVLFYYLITGSFPFEGSTAAEIRDAHSRALANRARTAVPETSTPPVRVLERAISISPTERFPDMAAFARALAGSMHEYANDSRTRRVPQEIASFSTQRLAVLALFGAVIATTAIAIAVLERTIRRSEPPVQLIQLSTYLGDEHFPSFAPDGNRVAFAWNGESRNNWDIYVETIGSGMQPQRITTDLAEDTMPAWSPDGTLIAFMRIHQDKFAIFVASPLGGDERRVTEWLRSRTRKSFGSATWTRDSKWLVMADLDEDGIVSRIDLVSVASGARRAIVTGTADSGVYAYVFPTVSPDGTTLAYDQCDSRFTCDVHVAALGRDYNMAGPARAVTHDGHTPAGLAWCRDSRSIICGDGLRLGLFRVTVSGSSSERLEIAGTGAMYPAVSPRGERLAYSRVEWAPHLWKFTNGGKNPPEVFLQSTVSDKTPQLSPDGERVAFTSERSGVGMQVWIANYDGSHPFFVTPSTKRRQGGPIWSPNGRLISYGGQLPDGSRRVFIVETTGRTPPYRLTQDTMDESGPCAWQGGWIYFGSKRTGRFEIWRTAPDGSSPEQITREGAVECTVAPQQDRIYYTKVDAYDRPLFTMPLPGGPERPLPESVYKLAFVAVEDGLYYVTRPNDQKENLFELRFLDSRTGRSVTLNQFESRDVLGLDISRDRTTLVTAGVSVTPGDDLMLLQNFR